MRELKNWSVFTDSETKLPHFHLTGDMYDSEGKWLGLLLKTTRVNYIENGIATTKCGTQYKLGHCEKREDCHG